MNNVDKYLAEVLLTEEQIQTRVAELGHQISKDYASRSPLLLGIEIDFQLRKGGQRVDRSRQNSQGEVICQ